MICGELAQAVDNIGYALKTAIRKRDATIRRARPRQVNPANRNARNPAVVSWEDGIVSQRTTE